MDCQTGTEAGAMWVTRQIQRKVPYELPERYRDRCHVSSQEDTEAGVMGVARQIQRQVPCGLPGRYRGRCHVSC